MVAKIRKNNSKTSVKPVKKAATHKKAGSSKMAKKSTNFSKSIPKKSKAKLKSTHKLTKKEVSKNKDKIFTISKSVSSIKSKKSITQDNKLKSKGATSRSKTNINKPIELANHEPIILVEDQNLNVNYLSGPSKFQPYAIDNAEEYMNQQQLNHFSNILEEWKQELMLEVDNTITEMKEADILADPNDRATQEETFNLELRARDRERKLIKKIEVALNKISEQKYGYCDSCGIEIGIRRLEARPTATLCIECKTLDEIREKRS